jgi:glycerol-3-phosphate dehydrogenase (NAD(P)+)
MGKFYHFVVKYPSMERKKVAIIGAGEIGLSLGKIMSAKADIFFWDKISEKTMELPGGDRSLPDIINESEIIFLCVPSWGLKEAMFCLSPYLKRKQIIITLSKGLEESSGLSALEFVSKLASKCKVGTLGGPMIAEEISRGHIGIGVLVAKDKKVFSVASIFEESNLKIITSSDYFGTAYASILKNIYALGLGIAEGLEWSHNQQGYFFGEAVKEMGRIIQQLGGKKDSIYHPALLADFVATGFSHDSLNHQVGLDLSQNAKPKRPSEGLVSIPILVKIIGREKIKNFPILYTLDQIVSSGISTQQAFFELEKNLVVSKH